MKKLMATIGIITVCALGAVSFAACGDDDDNKLNTKFSAAQAKQIVSTSMGVNLDSGNATVNSVVTNNRGNDIFYEVELTVDGVKYEYRVNANTGDIVKLEINDQIIDVETAPTVPANPSSDYIGFESAKAVAYTDLGIEATDATLISAELDYDDGMYLYEIEFSANGKEYEYEINATSGAIYTKDVDCISVTAPTTGYVPLADAKYTVFADASTTEAEVILTGAKFDVENGIHIYDIEFTLGTDEYEYEVNAATGVIIRKELNDEVVFPPHAEGGDFIGQEAAKTIAFNHAGVLAANATEVEVALDIERGVDVYEVEFKSGNYEYEYEINATTGVIIEVDKELD